MLDQIVLIRVGTRLAVTETGSLLRRLGFVIAGAALSVTIILGTLALNNALDLRQRRLALRGDLPFRGAIKIPGSASGVLWRTVAHHQIGGRTLTLIAVGIDGETAPVPPGVPRIPAPGEVFISPALKKALERQDEVSWLLRGMVQGNIVGQLTADVLLYPDEWVAVAGYQPTSLRATGIAQKIIQPVDPDQIQLPPRPLVQPLALTLGFVGLLIPSILLTATAIQIVATERAEMLAALRLIGATSSQICWLLAGEVLVGGLVGAVLGCVLALSFLPLAPLIPLADGFFPADLWIGFPIIVLVLLGTPLISIVVELVAVRRVVHAPLDVIRDVQWQPTSAKRILPLALGGIGLLLVLLAHSYLPELVLAVLEFIFFVIFLLGILIAGPMLVRVVALWIERFALSPSLWLAMRRIAENPARGFRLVATILLSVFLFGFLKMAGPSPAALQAAASTLAMRYRADLVVDLHGARPGRLVEHLANIPGVAAVVPVGSADGWVNGERWYILVGDCRDLPHVMNIEIDGRCTEATVFVRPNLVSQEVVMSRQPLRIQMLDMQGSVRELVAPVSGYFVTAFPDGSDVLVPPQLMGEQWQPIRILLKTDSRPQTYQAVLKAVIALVPPATLSPPMTISQGAGADTFQTTLSLLTGLAVLISCISLGQSLIGSLIESRHLIVGLRALGMQRIQLKYLFIGEITLLLILAFSLGIVLAVMLGTTVALTLGNPFHIPLGEMMIWFIMILVGTFLVSSVLWVLWIRDQTKLLTRDDYYFNYYQ